MFYDYIILYDIIGPAPPGEGQVGAVGREAAPAAHEHADLYNIYIYIYITHTSVHIYIYREREIYIDR